MNRLLCITIFALSLLIKDQVIAEKLEPQIKVTRIQLWYLNEKYINAQTYHITRHNATYNNIGLHWVVEKDLPADVVVNSRVYATDSDHKNAKLLLENTTPVCKESPSRQLLPPAVVLDESQLHGKCVKAGIYDTPDMGNFRFEVLLPKIHEISDHHYIRYRVGNAQEIIFEGTFYSEWGYLNTEDDAALQLPNSGCAK